MSKSAPQSQPKERKAGAPACGLYFRLSDDIALEKAVAMIREAAFVINRSSYERNMNVLELGGDITDAPSLQRLEALVALGRHEGMAVIVRQDIGLASAAQADGVLVDNTEEAEQARAVLGQEAIVGLRCGLSRMAAEKGLAAGVDYVSFAAAAHNILPQESLISWWGVKSEKPCLVEGPLTNDDCARYVRAGATFLEATAYVWGHPQGIKQGTIDMLYAIDLAVENISLQ